MFLPPTLGLDGVIIVADGVTAVVSDYAERESNEFHGSARPKWPRDYSLLIL